MLDDERIIALGVVAIGYLGLVEIMLNQRVTNDEPSAVSTESLPKVLVILNARSGSCVVDDVKRELAPHSDRVEIHYHEIAEGTDLESEVARAIAAGFSLFIAGGGDGTIAAIGHLLVGTEVEFALLPLGTANVLALELNIPTDLAGACRLAASRWVERDHEEKSSRVRAIDVMRANGRYCLTQVGVGIDAMMIQNTTSESKRRLGKLAYLMSATRHIIAFKPRGFTVTIDGGTQVLKASEIVVANTGMMGQKSLRWGPDIVPDDGNLNVCLFNPAGLHDYVRLFWVVFRGHREKSPSMRHQVVNRSITIKSRRPLPVQADGEIIGQTPTTIEVVPNALKVVVPQDKYP